MRENRETPLVSGGSTPGRREKATSYKASMNAGGESDEQVVPAKRLNKGGQSPAEGVEGSCSNAAIQNAIEPALPLTQVLPTFREPALASAELAFSRSVYQPSGSEPDNAAQKRLRFEVAWYPSRLLSFLLYWPST